MQAWKPFKLVLDVSGSEMKMVFMEELFKVDILLLNIIQGKS